MKADLASATSMLELATTKMSPYAGSYSEDQTIAAMEGQKSFEGGGGGNTTNLGGISISLSGVSDPDAIVDQIGPKILKYLQDNESRVGIR